MENARNFVLDNAEISFTDYNEMRAFVEEREKNTEWLEQGVRELVFGALHEEPLCAPVYAEKMHVSQEAIEDTMAGAGLKLTVSSGTRPVGASAVASIINRAGLQAAGWKKLRNGNLESLKSVLNMLMDVSSGRRPHQGGGRKDSRGAFREVYGTPRRPAAGYGERVFRPGMAERDV